VDSVYNCVNPSLLYNHRYGWVAGGPLIIPVPGTVLDTKLTNLLVPDLDFFGTNGYSRIVLREVENVQNWPWWTFPTIFQLE